MQIMCTKYVLFADIIPDEDITASTSDAEYPPTSARPLSGSSWKPDQAAPEDEPQWIQVNTCLSLNVKRVL